MINKFFLFFFEAALNAKPDASQSDTEKLKGPDNEIDVCII